MWPYLERYPDQAASLVLKQGFKQGFSLSYQGPRESSTCRNLLSARKHPGIVREKLAKEIQLGRMAGPFVWPPLPDMRVSPIGLVPKSSGSFRLIQHLSWPYGQSVNDGISDEAACVKYSSFDEAVQCIAISGKSTLLAKADVKSAFRLLPVRREDFNLLGIHVGGYFYVDKCLAMGCASSPALFETFSTFLEWATREEAHCNRLLHYADDFLAYGSHGTGPDSCWHVLKTFQEVCRKFGVPLAEEKTEGPVSSLVFLGLEIDAHQQVIRIPFDKLAKLRALIGQSCLAKKLTLRELQSVIGNLSFVCKAVPPGRGFPSQVNCTYKELETPKSQGSNYSRGV